MSRTGHGPAGRCPRPFRQVKELNFLIPGMPSFHALVYPAFVILVGSPCLIWHRFCRSTGYGLLSSFANMKNHISFFVSLDCLNFKNLSSFLNSKV